jgi:hypothetical protein
MQRDLSGRITRSLLFFSTVRDYVVGIGNTERPVWLRSRKDRLAEQVIGDFAQTGARKSHVRIRGWQVGGKARGAGALLCQSLTTLTIFAACDYLYFLSFPNLVRVVYNLCHWKVQGNDRTFNILFGKLFRVTQLQFPDHFPPNSLPPPERQFSSLLS